MDLELLNINDEDEGVDFKIVKLATGDYEVRINLTRSVAIAYQKLWYRLAFTVEQLKYFQYCLENGINSCHGNASVWHANKIYIVKHDAQRCLVNLYRRRFVVGVNVVPAVLTDRIVTEIERITA